MWQSQILVVTLSFLLLPTSLHPCSMLGCQRHPEHNTLSGLCARTCGSLWNRSHPDDSKLTASKTPPPRGNPPKAPGTFRRQCHALGPTDAPRGLSSSQIPILLQEEAWGRRVVSHRRWERPQTTLASPPHSQLGEEGKVWSEGTCVIPARGEALWL